MNIVYVEGTLPLADYQKILAQKIKEVCSKISFNHSTQTFHIYDPKFGIPKTIHDVLTGSNGNKYGYTDVKTWDIYISTLAIRNDMLFANDKISRMFDNISGLKKRDDFLADVIIDEITHVQTHKDHGNKEYDKKWLENMNLYYLDPFDKAMGITLTFKNH